MQGSTVDDTVDSSRSDGGGLHNEAYMEDSSASTTEGANTTTAWSMSCSSTAAWISSCSRRNLEKIVPREVGARMRWRDMENRRIENVQWDRNETKRQRSPQIQNLKLDEPSYLFNQRPSPKTSHSCVCIPKSGHGNSDPTVQSNSVHVTHGT